MRCVWWPILMASLLTGCAGGKRSPGTNASPGGPATNLNPKAVGAPKPPTVTVTPASSNVGKVSAVNAGARFVVVTYTLGNLPAPGRRLSIYRTGQKVGEVRITGPARDNNTVADILAGECQIGDEVRDE